MKKGGFLRNVLDTIRSNQANQPGGSGQTGGFAGSRGAEFGGLLKPSHFTLGQVARHGFPEQPSALAFDPVQKIAAIGTSSGAIRVFGRPGVDVWAQHKPEYAVTHIKFIVNQGAIITVTSDESIHLWSLRGPNLKLQLSASSSSSSPAAPQAATPTGGGASISPPQSTNVAGSLSSASAAAAHHLQHNLDTGAQSGDPDYLSDQIGSPSPTSDKSKQYSRQPEILHTLKFQREHITCLHQTLQSKWLYVGTERGNVHVVNVETFDLSGYSIAWNKAIELSRKTHPGAIIHISECPQDSNKILIGFESGCIVLWDLKSKNADGRYYHTENLLWLSWHYEGKQFVAAHGDGSLVTWQTRSNTRPAQILHPHVKAAPAPNPSSSDYDSQQQQNPHFASTLTRALNNELYRPINKVDWKTTRNNEQFLLFSGGLPYDGLEAELGGTADQPNLRQSAASPAGGRKSVASNTSQQQQQQQQYLKPASGQSPVSPSLSPSVQTGARQSSVGGSQQASSSAGNPKERKSLRPTSLTVMYGKSITVLEMDDAIIDFITICENSPYENDTTDISAVIVLLANDLILIDLTSSGYPSFESPYPASALNESPVTCVQYLADCSSDLIPFLYSTSQNVVSRAPKKGFSDKEWPINGGDWGQPMQSYPELVLTGHADGTIKFWDMSGVNFDLINKIKTSKLFERPQKLPNSIIVPANGANQFSSAPAPDRGSPGADPSQLQQQPQQRAEENFFAIERIEYCSATKHLLVAGNLSQVIQFRLNRKDTQQAGGGHEITTILVEPTCSSPAGSTMAQAPGNNALELNQSQQRQQQQQPKQQPHYALKAKSSLGAAGSSSGGSSSSAGSQRGRSSGFQAELICLTPMLVSQLPSGFDTHCSFSQVSQSGGQPAYCCQTPPKVTALAFQAAHNM